VKRLFPALLLGAALAFGPAGADEQADLEKLRKRIGLLQQELEKSSESKSEAADALRESERAISESNRKLASLSSRLRDASADLSQAQAQSARVKEEMQALLSRLSALLYHQYLGGRQDFLQLLLDNRDPNQAARDLQYYSYISHAQAAWLNALRDKLAQLNTLSAQAHQKTEELAALQQEAAAERQALEQDRLARKQVLARISAQVRQQNREISRLQRNENRLSQLVEKLAQVATQSSNRTFESLRGKLAMPVKGRVSNKFGARRPGSTVIWKGWFLRAPSGLEVRAVAPGQVVFADWLRGFGNLLIIDHGKGYMSLYGNNETLFKQVGDTLRGGETIATVGNSGGNEESGLYFELRRDGKPLDPAKWVMTK
jgi:septal ring factor EnvC (AmiA/AmiB activator)